MKTLSCEIRNWIVNVAISLYLPYTTVKFNKSLCLPGFIVVPFYHLLINGVF